MVSVDVALANLNRFFVQILPVAYAVLKMKSTTKTDANT